MQSQKNIAKIMQALEKRYKFHKKPTVRRTSESENPFKTLISCLLSLRSQDVNTAKTSKALFAVADTPEKIIKLPQKQLEKLIYSSGYYRNKAKTIKHVSKVILEKYKGGVPDKKEELLSIKGIGPKTANIVLCFSYGQIVIPVDSHVHIVSNRLGIVSAKTPEKTELELMKVMPKRYWKEINTLFILFGKDICLSISPLCSKCIFKNICPKIGIKRSR